MVRSATSASTSSGATSGGARQLVTGRLWLLGLAALGLLTWGSFQAGALLTRSESPSPPSTGQPSAGQLAARALDSLPHALGSLIPQNRMTVFFHPRLQDCTPHELQIARALLRVEREYPDIKIYTVLPRGAEISTLYGSTVPGDVVHVSPADFETARVEGPHPRIEVWDHPGRLLLLRSVPQTASEDDVYEEVSSARSFTRPLESDA